MRSDAGNELAQLGVSEIVAADPLVARWFSSTEKALLAGNHDHVERFKAQALRAAQELPAPVERPVEIRCANGDVRVWTGEFYMSV